MNEQEIKTASAWERMLNVLVCPGEVFEEVSRTPRCSANWHVPTLLVATAAIVSVLLSPIGANFGAGLREAGAVPDPLGRKVIVAGWWPIVSCLSIFVAAFGGSIWSAFVLWFIGRVFLKTRFSWLKALEIVGLSGIVLVLGLIVTAFLVTISGDVHTRPALSVLLGRLDRPTRIYQILRALDFFNIWSTVVMAIGLSKLARVSFKEAAFWVFWYWLGLRIVLAVLA